MVTFALFLSQVVGFVTGVHGVGLRRTVHVQRLPVWQYAPGAGIAETDGLAELCWQSVQERVDLEKFDIHYLNDTSIMEWLPDLPEEFFHLPSGARSEVARAAIIAQYGGIYIESDTALRVEVAELATRLEACPFYYTRDIVMARKGNPVAESWYNAMRKKLQSHCLDSQVEDRGSPLARSGACCHSPNGELLNVCHIPQGGVATPLWEGTLHSTQCAPEGQHPSDPVDSLAGVLIQKLSNAESSCWFEGADLLCNSSRSEHLEQDFLKRDSYHIDSMMAGAKLDTSRQSLLMGSASNTAVGSLLRNLVLGADIMDLAPSRHQCYDEGVAARDSGPRRTLSFIHIPRTGGTTIEDCTSHDPQEKWGCQNPDIHGLHRLPVYKNGKTAMCYKQHVPPAFLPDIYAGSETFCTVRDPYARMISQFGFLNIFFNVGGCSKENMNAKLERDLQSVKNGSPYQSDCHYLPQAAYVYRPDPQTLQVNTSDRVCTNVLHTERLDEEFNILAASHGYPYKLEQSKSRKTMSPKGCEEFSANDLSMAVRVLIEDIYSMDFELFGYSKLPSTE